MTSFEDRRDTMRVPVELRAWVRGGNGTFIPAEALDLNATGTQLRMPGLVRPGGRLDVYVKLQPGQEPICLRATAMWVQGTRAGLRFDPTPTPDRHRLLRWHHGQALLDVQRGCGGGPEALRDERQAS